MLEQAAIRKLIILDPSLKDMGGHYYEYDAAIAAAALRQAKPTWIYANKFCNNGLVFPGGQTHPWFSTEWSAAGGQTKAIVRHFLNMLPIVLRVPLSKLGQLAWKLTRRQRRKIIDSQTAPLSAAANTFGKEVVGALNHAGCNANDIVFLPTIRTSELFALWIAVKNTSDLRLLQFHVVLRRDAAEMDLPEDGAPGISILFQEMLVSPAGKSLHFYCDTEELCSDYAVLASSRLEFRILPIPFPNTNPDPVSLEKWRAGPATKLVYLGGARTEKGFHLLSHAVDVLRKQYPGKLLWRLQAPMGGTLEESDVIAARRDLSSVRDGSVDLVERNLSSAEFQSLLLSADIVLLPYLPEFYRARSSGILVQVLAAGKPVIVPSDSWLSSQTKGRGAVEFKDISRFPDAVLHALQRLDKLTAEAQERAISYAVHHSAEALLEAIETGTRADLDK